MAKGKKSQQKVIPTKKEPVGPVPDYKIPKNIKLDPKQIYPNDLEDARRMLIAAPKKDKWMYKITYKVLKQERYNGGFTSPKK